jgi:EmrB/QacA subfamily drug resistance transporter/deazaflavin-dependent oxidoreductase (nitroreductase family)
LGGLLLPAAVLGDRFGRRRLLMLGLLIFGAASVVASQVTSAMGLVVMRALMGVGSALIVPLIISILPSMFSEEERPRAVGFATAGVFLGFPLGPVFAGWLLTHFAWGSVFLINAPVVVIALLAVWVLVPESKDLNAPRLDWAGAILVAVGVASLVYAVIEEPAGGWTDAKVMAGLAGGAFILAIFVARELKTESPLVDPRLFLNRRFSWSTVGFVVIGFAMFGVMFVLTPYLQIVQGNDALGTGVRALPLVATLILGAVISDRLTARFGTKVMVSAGLLVTSGGLLLLSRASADSGYTQVAAALMVIGVGMGISMPPAVDAILGAVPSTQTGMGIGVQRTLQQVAAALGVAVLGSILNSIYRGELSGRLAGLPGPARDAALGSVAGAAAVARHVPGPVAGPLLQASHDAYTKGMAEVMLVSAGVLVAGALLIAMFLPARAAPVDRQKEGAATTASDFARDGGVPSLHARLLRWLPLFNPVTRFLLAAGVPLGPNELITIRGRKSGLPRTTPVAIINGSGSRWVWSPWGEVQWVRNLRAAGRATVTVRGRKEEVRATELDATQRVEFFRDSLGHVARSVPFGMGVNFIRIVDGVDLDRPLEAAEGRPVFELHPIR